MLDLPEKFGYIENINPPEGTCIGTSGTAKKVTVHPPTASRSKTLFWNVSERETLFRFNICVGG